MQGAETDRQSIGHAGRGRAEQTESIRSFSEGGAGPEQCSRKSLFG